MTQIKALAVRGRAMFVPCATVRGPTRMSATHPDPSLDSGEHHLKPALIAILIAAVTVVISLAFTGLPALTPVNLSRAIRGRGMRPGSIAPGVEANSVEAEGDRVGTALLRSLMPTARLPSPASRFVRRPLPPPAGEV